MRSVTTTANELLDLVPTGDARHYAFGILAATLATDGKITETSWAEAMATAARYASE